MPVRRSPGLTDPMNAATRKDMIDVDALSVGMFVHLDLGWMSHPFPLGNFKTSEIGRAHV